MTPSISPSRSILYYQKATLSMACKSSTNLNIRTREGDQVTLSMRQERSYSESREYVHGANGSEMQKFSVVARAASSYSLSIQGELNDEEMSAILNLAGQLSPLVEGFTGEMTGEQGEVQKAVSNIPDAIENFRYSVERSSSFSSGARLNQGMAPAVEDFPHSGNSWIRDLPALLKAVMDSIFMAAMEKSQNTEIFKDYAGFPPFLSIN